jgi:phosphatidylinositol alpha-1,6-mannosyltransferase
VDVTRFRPDAAAGARIRRDLGWGEDALVVGYLGRFEPQKGIADLCGALDQMRSPWRALFVGGGTLDATLRSFAASHPGRVHVATGVPHGDVPRWLNAMTILCAPSRTTATWREQFGRMLIESMACGVPVVASDSGEMPHVVGDAGRVLPEGNPAAWAAALDTLAGDRAALAELGQRGVARAHAVFSWPVVARQHLAFFDALMQEPHSP